MAPTTALHSQSAERILEDIDNQFKLGSDELLDIAQAFLQDVNEGLGKYGHPLAMMYVWVFKGIATRVFVHRESLGVVQRLSLVYRMELRLGEQA